MPRASKVNGRKQKDLSEYEAYSDKLSQAILTHVSLGGYVGIAHSYGSGLRLYVNYEDERETFEYNDPDHLDLLENELQDWRREVLDRRAAARGRKSDAGSRGTHSGAGGRKPRQTSF